MSTIQTKKKPLRAFSVQADNPDAMRTLTGSRMTMSEFYTSLRSAPSLHVQVSTPSMAIAIQRGLTAAVRLKAAYRGVGSETDRRAGVSSARDPNKELIGIWLHTESMP